jgi:hypothetical protein
MEDAVAEPCEHHQQQQDRVARPDPDQPDRKTEERKPGDQDAAGAEPVDQKADRRLGERRDPVQKRDRKAELDVVDPELALEQGKQRRQQQDVEMAEEMPDPDQAHDLEVVPGGQGCGPKRGHGRQIGRSRRCGKAVAV